MKRRDELQGMENQNHQLEGRKTRLLYIGRGLGKEVGMAIYLVPKIRMRKGRSLDHLVLLLQELAFVFHQKDLSRYLDLYFVVDYHLCIVFAFKAITCMDKMNKLNMMTSKVLLYEPL